MIEKKQKETKTQFGLVGRNISYSFSRNYFTSKFEKLNLKDHSYINYDIPRIEEFPSIFSDSTEGITGLNVTIPYKLKVIDFLDEIDPIAREIGAVNTIKVLSNGRLKGFNTDVFGFQNSLFPLLKPHHKKALILGSGGASKAVVFALKKLDIEYLIISRSPSNAKEISYAEIDEKIISEYHIIINCTPIGTHPNINNKPNLPYQFITSNHLLYDLIYNPNITAFLKEGQAKNSAIKNGLEMLELQAEKAWEIWTQ